MKVVKNTILNGGVNLFTSAANLLLVSIIVRYYGMEFYGCFALLKMMFYTGVPSLLDFSIPTVATRILSQEIGKKDSRALLLATGTCFWTSVLLGLSVYFIFILFWISSPSIFIKFLGLTSSRFEFFKLPFLFAFSSILLGFPSRALEAYFESSFKFSFLRKIECVSIIVSIAWAFFSVLFHLDFYTFVLFYIFIAAYFKPVWVMITYLLSHKVPFNDECSRGKLIQGVRVFYLNKFVGTIAVQAPQLLLNAFLGQHLLGIYDSLSKIPLAIKASFGFVNSVIAPFSVQSAMRGESEKIRELIIRGTSIALFIVVPLLLGFVGSSGSFIVIWLGRDFLQYQSVLVLLAFVSLTNIISGILITAASVEPLLVKKMTIYNAFEALSSVALLWFFVPQYGIFAVATVRFVITGFAFAYLLYYSLPIYKISLVSFLSVLKMPFLVSVFFLVSNHFLCRLMQFSFSSFLFCILVTGPLSLCVEYFFADAKLKNDCFLVFRQLPGVKRFIALEK